MLARHTAPLGKRKVSGGFFVCARMVTAHRMIRRGSGGERAQNDVPVFVDESGDRAMIGKSTVPVSRVQGGDPQATWQV